MITFPMDMGTFTVLVTYDETERQDEIIVVMEDDLAPFFPSDGQRSKILLEVATRLLMKPKPKVSLIQ